MAYVTSTELVARFGEQAMIDLTGGGQAGTIDQAVLDTAIADADAEIDGYLGVRYAVPVTPVPPMIESMAADMVRYRLMADLATDEVRRRYDDVVRRLRGISAGRLVLPGVASVQSDESRTATAIDPQPRVFSRGARS